MKLGGPTRTPMHEQEQNPFQIVLDADLEAFLLDTMYSWISVRESTPPQHRQLNIWIGNSKQYVDDFVVELTF